MLNKIVAFLLALTFSASVFAADAAKAGDKKPVDAANAAHQQEETAKEGEEAKK